MIYYFYGIQGASEDFDTATESSRTKLYKMFLKKLYKLLPGDWRTITLDNVNKFLFWKCPDGEQASLVFENKEIEFTNEEIDLIHEMYSTSGAMMGAGSGEIPKERSPKAHKRYVRIRFTRQGLQNFKPSPYFRSYEQQLGEKKNKKKRKRTSKSYCKSTPCKKMGFTQKASCKSQKIKDCYRGKKKN